MYLNILNNENVGSSKSWSPGRGAFWKRSSYYNKYISLGPLLPPSTSWMLPDRSAISVPERTFHDRMHISLSFRHFLTSSFPFPHLSAGLRHDPSKISLVISEHTPRNLSTPVSYGQDIFPPTHHRFKIYCPSKSFNIHPAQPSPRTHPFTLSLPFLCPLSATIGHPLHYWSFRNNAIIPRCRIVQGLIIHRDKSVRK